MLRRTAILIPALFALPLVAAPLHAGPPWISIELPANPLNPTTRGMFLLVRSYHHGDVMQMPVTGTATGLVDGKRQTVDLTFERTNMPGVYALRKSWPSNGAWVLAMNVGGREGPTALVGIGADGRVHSVDVPTKTEGRNTWGREVTEKDIEDALRQVASIGAQEQPERAGLAGIAVLLPVALGAAALRRRGSVQP
ncbi:MAG TPA: hypothetical protein VFT04_00865 [Gemmatimonadales bacterium]|nr:hypothetical protein [Gemmatimonadales bacterium]